MSQRMEFDETQRQQQEPPFNTYQAGYQDPFMNTFGGQKISAHGSGSSATSGQRLALAIVSVVMLIPLVGIILGTATGAAGFAGLFPALIALGVVCLTIMVVNLAFNRNH